MSEEPTVYGVGNALVDHTFQVTNIPAPDGGAFVLDRERRFGGVETNVAVLLSGLGVEAGIIARLGDDEDGDAVRTHLNTLPIDASRVRQVSGEETSYTHVLTDPDGQRAILGGGTSTLNLSVNDTDRTAIEAASATVASAYAPHAVLRELSTLDTKFVFDLAGRFEDLERRGLTRNALDEILDGINCFITGVEAAQSYLNCETNAADRLVDGLRSRGVDRGALTRGADGAVLFDASSTVSVEAIPVETIDTTGAGDAFTAGLVYAWVLKNRSMEAAGRFGAAAAAANCLVEGAHSDPPSIETVRGLLQ